MGIDIDPQILKQIDSLPADQKQELLEIVDQIADAEGRQKARGTFIDFVNTVWPQFISGRHHRIMATTFDRVIKGECKRVIINMAPRHTKSEFASFLLPAKYLGHYPDRKILQLSHNADLATGFGRRVRDLIDTRQYQEIFHGTNLKADQKAAGRWNTDQGGSYVSMGIGGRLAGIGADLLIIDDPHSEQEFIQAMMGDSSAFDKAYEWYQSGPRQRLQPGAAIVVVMTRWHMKDLTGKLIKRMTSGDRVDKWEIIEFPAFMPPDSENPLWPEFWSREELVATKNELSPQQWAAQYLQNPTSKQSAIIKKDWWRIWEDDEPPQCEFLIQSWDTAFTAKETADYSACTTWGVFYITDKGTGREKPNAILLDAFRGRYNFPELKRKAFNAYQKRTPDVLLVEAKASGLPLIHEMRETGIPVSEFTPSRGNDKFVRVNRVAPLFEEGVIWRPDARWAEEVEDEFTAFPGDHDDYVDSSTAALGRFREGGFISLDTDHEDDKPKRTSYSPY